MYKGATFTVPDNLYYFIIQIIDTLNYNISTVYPGQSIHITLDDLRYGNYVYLNTRTRPADDTKNSDGTSTIRFSCKEQPNNLEAIEGFAAVLRTYYPTVLKLSTNISIVL